MNIHPISSPKVYLGPVGTLYIDILDERNELTRSLVVAQETCHWISLSILWSGNFTTRVYTGHFPQHWVGEQSRRISFSSWSKPSSRSSCSVEVCIVPENFASHTSQPQPMKSFNCRSSLQDLKPETKQQNPEDALIWDSSRWPWRRRKCVPGLLPIWEI